MCAKPRKTTTLPGSELAAETPVLYVQPVVGYEDLGPVTTFAIPSTDCAPHHRCPGAWRST